MTDIFTNQYFVGAASMASIIGLVWLLVQVFSSSRKRLYYQRTTKVLVEVIPSTSISQKVTIGEVSGNRLVVDTLVFSNRSDRAITEDEFLSEVLLPFAEGTQVYSVVDLSLKNGAKVESVITENGIKLPTILLPRGKTIALAIFHNGTVLEELIAEPRQIQNLKRKRLKNTLTRLQEIDLVLLFFPLFSVLLIAQNPARFIEEKTDLALKGFPTALTLAICSTALVYVARKIVIRMAANNSSINAEEAHFHHEEITDRAIHALDQDLKHLETASA